MIKKHKTFLLRVNKNNMVKYKTIMEIIKITIIQNKSLNLKIHLVVH